MDKSLTIPVAAVVLPLFAAYLGTVAVLAARRPGGFTPWRLAVLTTTAIYGLGVLTVTSLPIQVNLGEYRSRNAWYTDLTPIPLITADLRSFALNIIMMVPLGFLLPLLSSRMDTVRRVAGRVALVSLSIETFQFLTGLILDSRRSVDVNDLIANTLGGVDGIYSLRLVLRWRPAAALISRFSGAPDRSSVTMSGHAR